MIRDLIQDKVFQALETLEIDVAKESILIDHPADWQFGDYSTNIAMVLAKKLGQNPKDLAEKIATQLAEQKNESISKVVAVGAFINFFLSEKFLAESVREVIEKGERFGQNDILNGQKTIIEYTDPNPFKLFHIGHLMSNSIGETLSRIIEANGAEVKRACYQGDVGLHVAKTLYSWLVSVKGGFSKDIFETDLNLKIGALGSFYAEGSNAYETNEEAKKEIIALNKKIYERSDEQVNELYDLGRAWSLDYFETIYRRLGTDHDRASGKAFDFYFLESETGKIGEDVVVDGLKKNIFETSESAVIFPGEKYGLHTRVFRNSEGLPTYEAKELGLAKTKSEKYPYEVSIIVTANEVNDYFKVLLKVMELLLPELATKTKHLGHGMLRLPTGKMSSRTGDVIAAEFLLGQVKDQILEKMKSSERGVENIDEVADQVVVGAIKYSILKQDIGKDIIFDFDKSLSFTGNSGPYLQYAFARTQSILNKAAEEGIKSEVKVEAENNNIEKLLYRFPEVVVRAGQEYAPHFICTYLFELADSFNSYYAQNLIVTKEENASYRVALTEAVGIVLKNGLKLLGIKAPEKM